MTLTSLRDSLDAFNIAEEGVDIMVETSDELIALNQSQLISSVGTDGEDLTKYSNAYYQYKVILRPNIGERYDMFLTGRSFSTMYLSFEADYQYKFKSDGEMQNWHDSTDKWYRDRLRPEVILGLTDDSKSYYRENSLLPNLRKALKNSLK